MESIKYFILEPATFKLDGGAMFGIIPKPMWNKVVSCDDLNRIEMSLRLMLIKTKDRLILIDTGIGDYHDDKFNKNFSVSSNKCPIVSAMESLGFSRDDLTDLIISHLHFDHVGGIGENKNGKMEPVFKNSNCHIHKKHFQYAQNPTARDIGSFRSNEFMPILNYYKDNNLLKFYDKEEGKFFELTKGHYLNYKCSHGHTPYLMHPYNKDFIYLADLIPTSHHVHIPWVMGYDINPGQTTKDKSSFLDFIIEKDLTVIYEHDLNYWGGKIEKTIKGYAPLNNCKNRNSLAYNISLKVP